MKKLILLAVLILWCGQANALTFGKSDIGVNNIAMGADEATTTKSVLSDSNATISKISVYMSSSGTHNAKAFILADGGTAPTGSPLCYSSSPVSITAAGWYDFPLSGCGTLAAGTYWLGFVTDSASVTEYYADAAGYAYKAAGSNFYATPNIITGAALNEARDRQYSIYATYTTSGGGGGTTSSQSYIILIE